MPKGKSKTSSKRSTSKTGKSGLKSNKFTSRARNVDYRYHIATVADAFQPGQIKCLANRPMIASQAVFIPLSNFENVAKSMRVEVKLTIPWAYAVFQNTPQLYDAFSRRLFPKGDGANNYYATTGIAPAVFDIGKSYASMYCFPVTGNNNQDYASMMQARDGDSFIVQLMKSQSTFGTVTTVDNANQFYSKTLSIYNQKSTQYLNAGSTRQNPFEQATIQQYSQDDFTILMDNFLKFRSWNQAFFANDMFLVIIPYSYITPNCKAADCYGTIEVQRQVYQLIQDVDIATQLLKYQQQVTIKKITQYVTQNAQNTQGGKQQQNKTRFFSTTPLNPLVQFDIDNYAEGQNSITVDGATMYNSNTGCVEAEGYMDLCPVPEDNGSSVAELDTSNANGFTKVGSRTDDASLLQANTNFTGPKWTEVVSGSTQGSVSAIAQTPYESYYLYIRIGYLPVVNIDAYFLPSTISFTLYSGNDVYYQHTATSPVFDVVIRGIDYDQDPSQHLIQATITVNSGTILYCQYEELVRFLQQPIFYLIQGTESQYEAGLGEIPFNIVVGGPGQTLVDYFSSLIQWPLEASKAWGRFKKFLRKCWKFLKHAIPIGSKVISTVCPGPIGAGAAIVGDTVTAIDTAVNAIAVSVQANQMFNTSQSTISSNDGQFVLTPQYRIGSSIVNPIQDGDDWTSADDLVVDTTNYALTHQFAVSHNVTNHTFLQQYRQAKQMGLNLQGTEPTVQQRIKFRFSKAMSALEAQSYKATLALGSDTFYTTGDQQSE